MVSSEQIQEQKRDDVMLSRARESDGYAPPKLEKMQKLTQVTGIPILTGVPI